MYQQKIIGLSIFLITILSGSHGVPELLASLLVIGLHLWKRNMMLSIAGGTVCYMVLVQHVFG